MRVYPTFFRIVFSGMDPEKAHKFGYHMIRAAACTPAGPLMRALMRPAPELATEALGLTFPSPFGVAAGFDKEGAAIVALSNLGFGHVEIGTVTAQAQPGNAKPRLFRLVEDRAVINRMGFNNDGAAAVAPRIRKAVDGLHRRWGRSRPIVGVNIGKTKKVDLADAIEDYLASTRLLAADADYLVVNVSSPNTPGLRQLQNIDSLRPLLASVGRTADETAGRHVPLLVKIAPDLTDEDIDDVARLALDLKLDGVVATNTTVRRDGLVTDPETVIAAGVGGLSGAPLKERSLQVLHRLRTALGEGPVIISVGGVESGSDVQQRLDAGANLVQGYTAFLYEGPFWAARINRQLQKLQRGGH